MVASRTAEGRVAELPPEELARLASELGLDPTAFDSIPALAAAVVNRRALIANLDREALLDVLRWAGRRVPTAAGNEPLAVEVCRVRSMRFSGLSHRGLLVLAKLRGLEVSDATPTPQVIEKLKRQEGLLAKLNRKRRAWMGKMVGRMLGEDDSPPTAAPQGPADPKQPPREPAGSSRPIHHEIEESGLIAGITSRVKRSADSYLNQKLDEIEARIDRKLDEIDRRLGEWRDKEIAQRIKILKISLWATVIVAIVTLILSYLRVYWRTL